ncbi:MAG: MFS transporter [Dehalococcoidia bacterium]
MKRPGGAGPGSRASVAAPRGRARRSPLALYLSRTFESLSVPEFRLVWLSMLLMMAGMNMQMVARGVLTYDLSNSPFMVGLVGAGFAPPVLLFSLFGGAVADRMDRKRIILLAQIGMTLLTVVIAAFIHAGAVTIWHLFGASLFQGTLFSFLMPARQSMIPRLVGDRLISNALALNAMGMSMMTLLAPGVGGVIYGAWGPAAAYDAIVLFNLGALVFTWLLPSVVVAGVQRDVLSDIRDGFRYVWRNRTVMALLMIALGTTMLAMPARNLLPVYVEDLFERGPEAVGLMLSVFGGGALVGSIFIAGLRRGARRGLYLVLATLLSGLSIFLLSVAPTYGVAVAVMLFMGLADVGRRALNNALVMEQTDDEHRGRVSGIWMMNFGLMPIGTLSVAGIAQVWGIRLAAAGAGVLLVAFAMWFLLVSRRVRSL